MNRLRQRKLIARENRQASLHSQGITVEKTSIKLPQPKVLEKKEKVIVEKNVKSIPNKNVIEVVKRGRGRPPKVSFPSTTRKLATGPSIKKGLTVSKKGKK